MEIKKNFLLPVIVLLVVLSVTLSCAKPAKENQLASKKIEEKKSSIWLVDKDGYLSYHLKRGDVKFRRDNYSETENLFVSKIIFQSINRNVYGLLVLPKNIRQPLPGVVLLPGAGVSKESELNLAEKISGLGAVVLTIDQRGTGETDGNFNSIVQDYLDFSKAKEPTSFLMVFDALRAYDLLYSAPFVDTSRIVFAGESLGGRIAIIAAAIERNIRGVLVISSSGLDFEETNDTMVNMFLKSIDSDHYIGLLAPRKIVMMHNEYDKIIPISSAIKSFKKAQNPKQFILINDTGCNHGYCDIMYEGLVGSLDYLFEINSRTLVSVPDK